MRVYWGGDRKWYFGCVTDYFRGVHKVHYDDGIPKWHRLDAERWEMLSCDRTRFDGLRWRD